MCNFLSSVVGDVVVWCEGASIFCRVGSVSSYINCGLQSEGTCMWLWCGVFAKPTVQVRQCCVLMAYRLPTNRAAHFIHISEPILQIPKQCLRRRRRRRLSTPQLPIYISGSDIDWWKLQCAENPDVTPHLIILTMNLRSWPHKLCFYIYLDGDSECEHFRE